jgi:hypothetical protein
VVRPAPGRVRADQDLADRVVADVAEDIDGLFGLADGYALGLTLSAALRVAAVGVILTVLRRG